MDCRRFSYLYSAGIFFILLGSWEVFCYATDTLHYVLPPPSAICLRLWEHRGRFLFHTTVTLREMAGGGCLAFVMAFPLAWVMHLWKTPRVVLQPFFVIIQCIPMFTLAPIMVIWFDWSYLAIVIPTALMIFFPLTMTLYQGLRSVPQNFLDYFNFNQATPWQRFIKLQLPWALPHLFAGLRISAAIAGVGAVAGEWAGAQEGLGLLMLESRRAADLETTFAALCCLTVVSVALYLITVGLEKKATPSRFTQLSWSQKAKMVCLFLLVGLCGWGCHEKQDGPDKKMRLLLDWMPNPNHIPLYVGIKQGIFHHHGIDLVIKKMRDSSDSLTYLTSGQAELAISYFPHTARSFHRGVAVTLVGILIKEPLNALIYRQEVPIKEPADLNEKVIGYCVDGTTCSFLKTLLGANQIEPKKMHNVSCDLTSALATAKVDVIYGGFWNIECEHLRLMGVKTGHLSLSELGVPSYPELIILAKPQTYQASPQFITSFQDALQESIDFCVSHPEKAFALYLDYHPDKGDKTCQWEKQAWLKTIPTLADTQEMVQQGEALFSHHISWLERLHRARG